MEKLCCKCAQEECPRCLEERKLVLEWTSYGYLFLLVINCIKLVKHYYYYENVEKPNDEEEVD